MALKQETELECKALGVLLALAVICATINYFLQLPVSR